jgi:hypothetical protein
MELVTASSKACLADIQEGELNHCEKYQLRSQARHLSGMCSGDETYCQILEAGHAV